MMVCVRASIIHTTIYMHTDACVTTTTTTTKMKTSGLGVLRLL